MDDDEKMEGVVDGVMDEVEAIANNTKRFSADESLEIYEMVAQRCMEWVRTLKSERIV